MIFDKTGSLGTMTRHDYLPFGEELMANTGLRATTQGYTASGYTAADKARQKFTKQERDDETGMDYMHARYYTNGQGRFTSADSFGGSIGNPQSLNRYAYVTNNPMNLSDPTGHEGRYNAHGVTNWTPSILDYLSNPWVSEPMMGQDPVKADLPAALAPEGVPGIPAGTPGVATIVGYYPISPPKQGWFRRSLSAVGRGLSAVGRAASGIGNAIFIAGNPGYDDDFAETYQPKITDFCPAGRQCAIFFPFGGVGPGAFLEEDLALGVHENLGTFRGAARIGTDLPVTDDLWNALAKGIEETVDNGGRIRFNLDGVDVKGAFDPGSPVYNTYTSRELRYITNSIYLTERTTFYS